MQNNQLEDITSKEFLDTALRNAANWCKGNLHKHLEGFNNGIDYSIFSYVVNNELIGPDMCLDEKKPGLIMVSTDKLFWYKQKEVYFKEIGMRRYALVERKPVNIIGAVEVDPESMFVHEIVEFILSKDAETFFHYFSKLEFPHDIAYQIENINRLERGLKPWPEY